MTVPNLVRIW